MRPARQTTWQISHWVVLSTILLTIWLGLASVRHQTDLTPLHPLITIASYFQVSVTGWLSNRPQFMIQSPRHFLSRNSPYPGLYAFILLIWPVLLPLPELADAQSTLCTRRPA